MTFLTSIRQAHQRRKAARQLREMPPHLLRDIGVEPGQIDEAVSGMLAAREMPEAARPAPRRASRQVSKPAPDLLLFKAAVFSTADWPYSRRHAS